MPGPVGNDTLKGGTGNDKFGFYSGPFGFGNASIWDFGDVAGNNDVIEFHKSVFANFAAVKAAMSQVGGNVVISKDTPTQ